MNPLLTVPEHRSNLNGASLEAAPNNGGIRFESQPAAVGMVGAA